jgi:glycosyltransferase involved in cell wall biosynthesis
LRNLGALIAFQVFLAVNLWKMRKDIEAIHAADFSTALTGLLMARLLRVPLVYDIYDYYVESFPVPKALAPLIELLDVAVINRADAVIIVTEARIAQIRKASPKSLTVIHNSPDSAGHSSEQTAPQPNRLVYVGILSEGRLLEELLSVFARRDDWELHIGGFGSLEQTVEAYAAENDNIVYHGRLQYTQTLQLEAEGSVLFAVYDPTVPNHKYSAPNKFYEALFLGKPLIVARGTGVDALVDEYGVGIVVEYTAESFERGLETLLGEPKLLLEMGERGQQAFASHFSWSIMEERLYGVYRQVLDDSKPSKAGALAP